MLLLEQMLVLFIIMCVGFICQRRGIITDEVNGKLSAIVVNVANPAMILSSGMDSERARAGDLPVIALLVAVMFACLILLAVFLPRLLRLPRESWGSYRLMTVFGNIGFMGFPIIEAVYGKTALLYATVFVIVFNILIYTYGISVLSPSGEKGKGLGRLKKVLNIGVIACVLALTAYLSGFQAPEFVRKTASLLGGMTSPLSMLVIGSSLAGMELRSFLKDKKLLLFMLIRLLAIPALGLLAVRQFISDELILGVCMVMLAAPAASMTTMLSRQYGGDHELTAKGVALSTVLSVITMPVIQMIL